MPFHLNSGREAHDSQHHKAVRRRCRRECRSLMAAYRRVCVAVGDRWPVVDPQL